MAESREPERMADFFDVRSEGYDAHMERTVADFDRFYQSIAIPIPETGEALRILDIGCGTGLELDAILSKAPNAVITGIDLSERMLTKLREKHRDRGEQLSLTQGSYLEVPLGKSTYDYAVAVMTLHHLLPTRKLELYRRIGRALKPGGAYIEGDWVVPSEEELRYLSEYEELAVRLSSGLAWSLSNGPAEEPESPDGGSYHVDVPLSLETQRRLLFEAGFSHVDVIWQADDNAIYVARG